MRKVLNEENLEWEKTVHMGRLVYPLCLYFFFNIGWLTQKGAADVFGYLVAA